MMAKIILAIVNLVLAVNYVTSLELVNGRIKISTVTTSGCGDTVNFINNQLAPAYQEYKEFLDLEFIPWGRTVWNEDDTFTCQFRQPDCWANRLHRCALDMLKGNQDAQLEYMLCEFNPPYPSYLEGSYTCAHASGLNLVAISNCMRGHADALDQDARDKAQQPMEIINFVPAIVLNDNIDRFASFEARDRLSSMICFALAEDPTTGVTSCRI